MAKHARSSARRIGILTILGTYLPFVRRYPRTGIFTFVFYAGGAILGDIVMAQYYRSLIDLVAGNDPTNTWQAALSLLIQMAIIMLGYNICWRCADFCMTAFQSRVLRDLINAGFQALTDRSYAFFAGQYTGGIVAKARRYVTAFETIHDKLVFQFWQTSITLTGVFLVFLWQLPIMAAFFGMWVLAYLGISVLFARYRMRHDDALATADSAVTARLSDVVTNMLNVKIFASRQREMKNFESITQQEWLFRTRAWNLTNIFFALQSFSMGILEIGGLWICLQLWREGIISGGTIVLVQFYFSMVMMRTWEIGRAISDTFKAFVNAREFTEILLQEPEVKDSKKPKVCRILQGSIDIRSIDFAYNDPQKIFRQFSLTIPAGQRVGIVGTSGAGKSTLMKLLLRFLDIQAGEILIDGQDIRSITQDDLRRQISFVPQDPSLYHRSLFENIAEGRAGAKLEAVIAAAKKAHAHDFIARLPKQYDTLVGERGIKLSGGERQRVVLARVILKDAPILLLDEATSALDSISERYVQEELATLMEGRTTVAIAHRISTIKQMDRIVVLEHGKIAEDGSHAELLAKNGTYARLWEHQSEGFLVEDTPASASQKTPH